MDSQLENFSDDACGRIEAPSSGSDDWRRRSFSTLFEVAFFCNIALESTASARPALSHVPCSPWQDVLDAGMIADSNVKMICQRQNIL